MMTPQKTASSQSDPDRRLAKGLGWFSIALGAAEIVAPNQVAALIGASAGPRTRTMLRIYGAREIMAGLGILAQRRPAGWLWGRVAGDVLDIGSVVAVMLAGGADRDRAGIAIAALLGVTALDYHSADTLTHKTAQTGTTDDGRIKITQSIIIERPLDELYTYWHDFENLPKFMSHLQSVRVTGERQTHWITSAPAGRKMEWDAEVTADEPNKRISWRSLPGSDVDHSGTVYFQPATGGRGTLVRVELQYDPPGGRIGSVIAKLFREEPKQQIYDDLRAFKQIMETGEKARSDASIVPGKHPAQPPAKAAELALT
ncbi:MAG: SRPBCC family protein [Acidobacteriaceae bacterium]|nr:SRPBCC family protein [Acidobacteriaceae bacterium]